MMSTLLLTMKKKSIFIKKKYTITLSSIHYYIPLYSLEKYFLTKICSIFFIPGGCANITCEFYSVCKSQGIGRPGVCVCPEDCVEEEVQDVMIVEKDMNKVCGTDGQTYQSECLMKIAACNKQQYIVVANKGECGK